MARRNVSISVDEANVLDEVTIQNGFDGYFTFEIDEKGLCLGIPGMYKSDAINYNPYAKLTTDHV